MSDEKEISPEPAATTMSEMKHKLTISVTENAGGSDYKIKDESGAEPYKVIRAPTSLHTKLSIVDSSDKELFTIAQALGHANACDDIYLPGEKKFIRVKHDWSFFIPDSVRRKWEITAEDDSKTKFKAKKWIWQGGLNIVRDGKSVCIITYAKLLTSNSDWTVEYNDPNDVITALGIAICLQRQFRLEQKHSS